MQLNNIGTNVMKLAINQRQQLAPEERPRLTRYPLWSSGFAMFALGTAMSFGAFKFAAQSLLSSLASVQFLSQVVFSRFVLKERIEKYAYVGVGLTISGCVCIVIFGAHGTKNYRPEELAALYGRSEYVCYMLGAGFTACVVSLLYTAMKQRIMRQNNVGRFDIAHASIRQRQVLAVFFSIKSALFGTQAVVLAKSLSMLLIQALHPNPAYSNPLLSYQTYFILLGFIAAATFWVTRLNHGLRLFEAVYLVPMMQICWILFSTIAGGIYYEEFIEFGSKEYAAYAVGFLCVLIGVALLCPRDDAKSLNAADVIYEIVSDENPLLRNAGAGNQLDDDDHHYHHERADLESNPPPSDESSTDRIKKANLKPYNNKMHDDIDNGSEQETLVYEQKQHGQTKMPRMQRYHQHQHHTHPYSPVRDVDDDQRRYAHASANGKSPRSPLPPTQPPHRSGDVNLNNYNHDANNQSPPHRSSHNHSQSPLTNGHVGHLHESGDIGSREAITPSIDRQ